MTFLLLLTKSLVPIFEKHFLSLFSHLSAIFFPLFLQWVQPKPNEKRQSGHLTIEVASIDGIVSSSSLSRETRFCMTKGPPLFVRKSSSPSFLPSLTPAFPYQTESWIFSKNFFKFCFGLGVLFYCGEVHIKFIISTIVMYTIQWHLVQAQCYMTVTTI